MESEAAVDKDVPCSFCGASVVATLFVSCAACDVPAHRECWAANGKCSAFACGSERFVDPAVRIYRKPASTAVQVVAPPPPPVLAAAGGLPARADLIARRDRLLAMQTTARRELRPFNLAFALSMLAGMGIGFGGLFSGMLWIFLLGMSGMVVGILASASGANKPMQRVRTTMLELERIDLQLAEIEEAERGR